MPYVGRGLTTGAQYQKLDAIAINNATTFTMSVGSANVSPDQNHLILVVNGVIQEPGTGFTVSGSTCTLASAITTSGHSGTDTIYGVIAGDAAFAAYDSIGVNALGVTAGTVTASRAVVPDSNKDIASFRNVTLTGELDAATLDISGNADIDGTLEADAITVDGTALATYIRDTVGNNMVSSNTESGITVTYDTSNDNIDFAVDAAQTGITSLLATDIKIGEDDQTKIDFETADEIHFYAANAEQVYVADGVFGPQTDSDVDLGSNSVRWKNAYVDSVTSTGAISGTTGTFTGDIKNSSDSSSMYVGASDDLRIVHDGSNSYIDHENTGDLRIRCRRHNGDIQFYNEDSGGTETLTLQLTGASNANFAGVITINTSASEQLMLKGATSPYLRFYESSGGSDTAKAYIQWHSDGYLNLENSEASTNLAVGANGVGIGTTAINNELVVSSSSGPTLAIGRESTISDTGVLGNIVFMGSENSGSNWGLGAQIRAKVTQDWTEGSAEGTKLEFFTTDNSSATRDLRMTIDHDGSITHQGAGGAIKTDSDGSTLSFSKDATNTITSTGASSVIHIIAESNGVSLANSGTSWGSLSDERLKENWSYFDNALDKINTLTKIGTYNPIDRETKKVDEDCVLTGLSADEVKKILPTAITEDEEGYKVLQYQDVFVLMLKSIQELSAKVEALENK